MLRKVWILFALCAVVMLPAAVTSVALWLGVDPYTLVWNRLLTLLMMPPVMLRCLYLPQVLCVLNGLNLLFEGVCCWQIRRVRTGLIISAVSLGILAISFPGLEMFFLAMMGI